MPVGAIAKAFGLYVFSRRTALAAALVGEHGLEARGTTARPHGPLAGMAVPQQRGLAPLNTHFGLEAGTVKYATESPQFCREPVSNGQEKSFGPLAGGRFLSPNNSKAPICQGHVCIYRMKQKKVLDRPRQTGKMI